MSALAVSAVEDKQPLVLFDFDKDFDIGSVIVTDAKITLTKGGALLLETGHNKPWPGITLKAPAGKWDLSGHEYISVDN
jgi:hypothetical protein